MTKRDSLNGGLEREDFNKCHVDVLAKVVRNPNMKDLP